jgi:hypothetical protein
MVSAGTAITVSAAEAPLFATAMPWPAALGLGLAPLIIAGLYYAYRLQQGAKALDKALQRSDLSQVAEVINAALGEPPERCGRGRRRPGE